MTIEQAKLEIERKHPGFLSHYNRDRRTHTQWLCWFYHWSRDEYGDVILADYWDEIHGN